MDMEEVRNRYQVIEALQPAVDVLQLGQTVIRRMKLSWLKDNLDDTKVERIIGPLPLEKPCEIGEQLEKIGGVGIFFSEPGNTEIKAWWATHELYDVLSDLGLAVAAILKAYPCGKLMVNLHMVTRALATLAMSAVMPGSELLRHDLADILGSGPEDGVSLIGQYRKIVLSGDMKVVVAIDQRIMSDSMWGPWAENFLDHCGEMLRPQKAITEWIFPETAALETNSDGIRQWLFRR